VSDALYFIAFELIKNTSFCKHNKFSEYKREVQQICILYLFVITNLKKPYYSKDRSIEQQMVRSFQTIDFYEFLSHLFKVDNATSIMLCIFYYIIPKGTDETS
jgi:hypothetical protein